MIIVVILLWVLGIVAILDSLIPSCFHDWEDKAIYESEGMIIVMAHQKCRNCGEIKSIK